MEKILDLDAMLDGNMDAVEDIPDYVTPPAGVYMLKINKVELDKREGKDGADDTIRIVSTIEVVESKEVEGMPVADGSFFTERFTYSEEGLQYFKRFAKNWLNTSDINGVSLRDTFEALTSNPPITAVVTVATTKGKDGKDYTNTRVRPVHEAAA